MHVPDRDKANALNAYFSSTVTRDNGFLLTFDNKSGSNSISDVIFSAFAVKKALRKISKG